MRLCHQLVNAVWQLWMESHLSQMHFVLIQRWIYSALLYWWKKQNPCQSSINQVKLLYFFSGRLNILKCIFFKVEVFPQLCVCLKAKKSPSKNLWHIRHQGIKIWSERSRVCVGVWGGWAACGLICYDIGMADSGYFRFTPLSGFKA